MNSVCDVFMPLMKLKPRSSFPGKHNRRELGRVSCAICSRCSNDKSLSVIPIWEIAQLSFFAKAVTL